MIERMTAEAFRAASQKPKRSKFHADPVWCCPHCDVPMARPASRRTVDPCVSCGEHVRAVFFPSKREWRRWAALRREEKLGRIAGLKRQVRMPLWVTSPAGAPVEIAVYVADFAYTRDDRRVVEDAKGMRTPEYLLKRKMVAGLYGVEILES